MNTLDSRFLRLGDCFAQKFSKAGTYRYIVTSGAGSCLSAEEGEYTIVVGAGPAGKGKAKGKTQSQNSQQNVLVHLQDGKLVAEPAEIHIKAGDTVIWHTPDAATPGFAVIGQSEQGKFNSGALAVEAVYSHAFGSAGTYCWVDANGGSVQGEIVVEPMKVKHQDDCRKWLDSLSKATLIKVAGKKAEPARVKILAGQTVFWAVEKASGISITDSRMVAGRAAK
jgi:plastocyanin